MPPNSEFRFDSHFNLLLVQLEPLTYTFSPAKHAQQMFLTFFPRPGHHFPDIVPPHKGEGGLAQSKRFVHTTPDWCSDTLLGLAQNQLEPLTYVFSRGCTRCTGDQEVWRVWGVGELGCNTQLGPSFHCVCQNAILSKGHRRSGAF